MVNRLAHFEEGRAKGTQGDLSFSKSPSVASGSSRLPGAVTIGTEQDSQPVNRLAGFESQERRGGNKRADGTEKGLGFFGELQRPDGKVSTELSIGVGFDGQETEIPTLVPTLTRTEVDSLLAGGEITEEITQKAVDHAQSRFQQGKGAFAEEGEQQETPKQDLTNITEEQLLQRDQQLKTDIGSILIKSGLIQSKEEEAKQTEADIQAKRSEVAKRGRTAFEEVKNSLKRGGLNVTAGLGGTLEELARLADKPILNQLGEVGAEFAEQARISLKDPELTPTSFENKTPSEKVKLFIAQTIPETLSFMVGTTVATIVGGPVAGGAFAFSVEGENAFQDALENGATSEEANIDRLVVGTINAALEQLQVKNVLKFGEEGLETLARVAKDRTFASIKEAGKEVTLAGLKQFITEGLQEATQEAVSIGTPAIRTGEIPELDEAAKQIGLAGLAGGVSGLFLGGGAAGVDVLAGGIARKQAELEAGEQIITPTQKIAKEVSEELVSPEVKASQDKAIKQAEEKGLIEKAENRLADIEKEVAPKAEAKKEVKPTEAVTGEVGVIKELGTRNQFIENNPFREKADEAFGTPKWKPLVKKSNIWEMQQVLKDKPVYWNQNSKLAPSAEDVKAFAETNKLVYKHTKRGDFVAKTNNAMDKMQKALSEDNPRDIGLALGFEDLRTQPPQGKAEVKGKEKVEAKKPTIKKPKPAPKADTEIEQVETEKTAKVQQEISNVIETDFTKDNTSARKESVKRDRESLGLDVTNSQDRKSWEESLQQAKKEGVPKKASRLAAEIIESPRSLNDVETAGMTIRMAELKKEHAELSKEIAGEEDTAILIPKAAELQRVEDEFDDVSRAVKLSGTEKGRALVSQKLTINKDFDLISVLNRAKVAKRKTLSAREESQFKKLTEDLQKSNEKIDKLQLEVFEIKALNTVKRGAKRFNRMSLVQKDRDLSSLVAETNELLKQGCNN